MPNANDSVAKAGLAGSEMPEAEAIVGKARESWGREAGYTGRPAPAAETQAVSQARPELPRSKVSNSAGRLARPLGAHRPHRNNPPAHSSTKPPSTDPPDAALEQLAAFGSLAAYTEQTGGRRSSLWFALQR